MNEYTQSTFIHVLIEEDHGQKADEEHETRRKVLIEDQSWTPAAAGSPEAAQVFKDLFKNTFKTDTSRLDVERGEATADGDAAFLNCRLGGWNQSAAWNELHILSTVTHVYL